MNLECLGALGVLLGLALLLAPFVSVTLAWGLRRRVRELEEQAGAADLSQRLASLEREIAALRGTLAKATAGAPDSTAAPAPEPVRRAAPAPEEAPKRATAPVAPPPLAPAALVPPPLGAAPAAPLATPEPGGAAPEAAAAPPRPTPELPRPVAERPGPPIPTFSAPPSEPKAAFDWERLIGVKLFSWIAGVALVVAAVFFLRYSVDQGWLSPPVRMALGLLAGIGLLVGCELRAARRYRVTANALDAAGIAILFATFFAAHVLWGLLPLLATFLLMGLVTAVAVLLSIRRDSVFIALLGLVGGFATPMLLSGPEDRTVPLFGYLVLLNLGLAWVAVKKRWPLLAALSLAATTLYQWQWVVKFLDSPRMPLGLGIFLLFPALFAAVLLTRRPSGEEEPERAFTATAAWAASLPLAFAVYLATVPAYADRFLLLFGFLGLLVLGLSAIAVWRGPTWLHLAGCGTAVLVFALWFRGSYSPAAWPAVLGLAAAFIAFLLAAPFGAERLGRPRFYADARRGTYAGALLFFAFPVLAALEPATVRPWLLFGALLPLLALAAFVAVRRRLPETFFVAASLAVVGEWVWTAKRLAPERILEALAVLAVFALFYLAIPLVVRRLGEEGSGFRGSAYLALSAPLLMLYAAVRPEIAAEPWPLLAVLGVLALAFAAAALAGADGLLLAGGLVASELFLLVWAGTARQAPWPATAATFAVLLAALGVGAWFAARRRRPGGEPIPSFELAAALGLLGAQAVVMLATVLPGYPGLATVAGLHLALVLLWLVLAAASGRHVLAVVAVVPSALAVAVWQLRHFAAERWSEELLLAGLLYLPFAAYPLVLGRRALAARAPYLAAILATAPAFFFGHHAMVRGGAEGVIGLLPVTLAAVLAVTLWRLLATEPAAERDTGRLAMVVGAVLALVTVAIPLQLEKEWITVGWALLGAALVWAYRRLAHRGLLAWAVGLFAAVFLRLAANPAVLTYHPRSDVPIWNWYLYTYLAAVASLFLAVWLLSGKDDRLFEGLRARPLFAGAGTVLLFLLLNIEIADFFSTGTTLTFGFLSGESSLAEDLAYTIGWGVFAMGLLAAGLYLGHKVVRVCAIVLLSATVLKAFLYDLSQLGGLYRVASFVGLAVCLALVALLLQRFVLAPREGEQ